MTLEDFNDVWRLVRQWNIMNQPDHIFFTMNVSCYIPCNDCEGSIRRNIPSLKIIKELL